MKGTAPVALRTAFLLALASLYTGLLYGGLHAGPLLRPIYDRLQMKLPAPSEIAFALFFVVGKTWWLIGLLIVVLAFLTLRGSLDRRLPALLIATGAVPSVLIISIWMLSYPLTLIQQQLQGS